MMRVASCILIVVLGAASDWPRFHGPNGTGTANGSDDVPVEFSPTKNLLWKAALPGLGNGSPIIVNGRVVVTSDADAGTKRQLLCFDAATGKLRWKHESPGQKTRIHRKNSLASSTPAADGERIVSVFWNGADVQLVGFDLDGKVLWEKNLGKFISEHGAGLSPIIHNQLVYLVNDHDEDSHALCFDAKTGTTKWSAQRQHFNACYSTPFIRQHQGRDELIVTTTAGVTAYHPADGTVIWDYSWDWTYTKNPLRTVGSSFLGGGMIFAHAGNGAGNSHALAIEPPEQAGSQPKLAWERKKSFPYVPSMLVRESWLFTVTDRGVAGCYDVRTGAEVWVERLGGGFSASPILFRDRIYAFSEDGTAYVYDAGPKFQIRARNALGDAVIASPAIADGRLLVRGKSTLYCFSTSLPKTD